MRWKNKPEEWRRKAIMFENVIHHVFLQLTFADDIETVEAYMDLLEKYNLNKVEISPDKIAKQCIVEVATGQYETTLKALGKESEKGSYTAMAFITTVAEDLIETH